MSSRVRVMTVTRYAQQVLLNEKLFLKSKQIHNKKKSGFEGELNFKEWEGKGWTGETESRWGHSGDQGR